MLHAKFSNMLVVSLSSQITPNFVHIYALFSQTRSHILTSHEEAIGLGVVLFP